MIVNVWLLLGNILNKKANIPLPSSIELCYFNGTESLIGSEVYTQSMTDLVSPTWSENSDSGQVPIAVNLRLIIVTKVYCFISPKST